MNSDSQLSTPPAGSQFPATSELARQFQDGALVSTPVAGGALRDPAQELRFALDHNTGLQQVLQERDRALNELQEGESDEQGERGGDEFVALAERSLVGQVYGNGLPSTV